MKRSILAVVSACVLVALVLLVVVLSADSGSKPNPISRSPLPRPTVATVKATVGHSCASGNFALQCALPQQPLTPIVADRVSAHYSARAASVVGLYGVDFAWGGPRSCALMRSLGAHFGASYESYDQSKGWNLGLVRAFHACGIGTTVVWETAGDRATRGFSAGVSDALEARRQAAGLGNTDGAITFAIDFDASGPQVAEYFRGVHSILGARGNAYGGYYPLLWLYQHGLVGHLNWQTYAWSYGRWLPASIAPLEQYLNGNAFDHDRAIAANYGQWPVPHVGPSDATVKHWRAVRNLRFRQYVKYGCKYPQQSQPCRSLGGKVEYVQHLLWRVYPRKTWGACFGPRARVRAAVCRVVRPKASHWSQRRAVASREYGRLGCLSKGPVTFPTPNSDRACRGWAHIYRWFNARASALVRAYS